MTDTYPTAEERLRLLEDAISNIDYPGSDSEEWTDKALGHARALAGDVAAERARADKAESMLRLANRNTKRRGDQRDALQARIEAIKAAWAVSDKAVSDALFAGDQPAAAPERGEAKRAYDEGRWCGECAFGVVEDPPCCTLPATPEPWATNAFIDFANRPTAETPHLDPEPFMGPTGDRFPDEKGQNIPRGDGYWARWFDPRPGYSRNRADYEEK